MRFEFEDRYHQVHEIKRKFAIKDKTWKSWIYPCIRGKTKKQNEVDIKEMGLRKIPGSNYYVVDPHKFQDWFLNLVGAPDEE